MNEYLHLSNGVNTEKTLKFHLITEKKEISVKNRVNISLTKENSKNKNVTTPIILRKQLFSLKNHMHVIFNQGQMNER